MRLETRLHRARVDRGIDLSDLSARTRIHPHLLRKIDEGRFAELPPGIYARSYVRAFASAVGLEPGQVVQELASVLPDVPDPVESLRDVIGEPRLTRAAVAEVTVKLPGTRGVAAAFDAAVLLSIDAALVALIALICGVDVRTLMNQAGAAVAMFCVIPVALYFVLFCGVGGRTPGAWVCRLPESRASEPLRLQTILLRTVWK